MTENPEKATGKVSRPSYLEEPVPKQDETREPKEKVVTGKTTVAKKTFGKELREAMIGDVQEVRGYLLWDVFIPAVKDTIVDLVKNGVEALFYGNASNNTSNVSRHGSTSYVSYNSYSDLRNNRRIPPSGRSSSGRQVARTPFDLDQIIFSSRSDAEKVLDYMVEFTYVYGIATVADFKDLAGVSSNYTDHNYGWGELSRASVDRTRDGYVIRLPKPEPIRD